MTDLQELDKVINDRLEQNLNELAAFCAQPSISAQGKGMKKCASQAAEMLAARGFEVQILPTDGYPAVFGQRSGQTNATLLFYNHYDVQPPEPLELWESPPFEPTIRNGKMFARGVSDDKGHIACRLAAIDSFLAVEGELPCQIKFIIEGEEEIGSVNLAPVIKQYQDLLSADACIWEFGGVNDDGIPIQSAGLRGICYVELSVHTATRDAHSGLGGSIFPNAAWRLIWALSSLKSLDERILLPGFYDHVIPPSSRDLELLENLPDESIPWKRDYGLKNFLKDLAGGVELRQREVFEPTCTICGLTSGYQGPGSKTVLPAEAKAKVDFRLVPNQRPEEVLQQLRTHLDAEDFSDIQITCLGSNPPGRTDLDDPFLHLVVDTAKDVYGTPQLIAPLSGGSGPNHLFLNILNLPVATAGISYPGANIHAPNENIVIKHFLDGVRHTARIINRFAKIYA